MDSASRPNTREVQDENNEGAKLREISELRNSHSLRMSCSAGSYCGNDDVDFVKQLLILKSLT